LKWDEFPPDDSILDHAREDLRDAIEVFQGKEAADKWYNTGTTFVDGVVSDMSITPISREPYYCETCNKAHVWGGKDYMEHKHVIVLTRKDLNGESRDEFRDFVNKKAITGDVSEVVIPIGVVPDIPVEDAIPEDLIPGDLVRDINEGLIVDLTEKALAGEIDTATVTIDMKDIPVYDVRGTEYEKDYNEQDRIFLDGEPVKRPPDKLKVGTAKLTTDKNGNINAEMTIDMDDIAFEIATGREIMGAVVDMGEGKYRHDIPVLSPGGVVSEETMNELGIKPPSGAKHLTVKPGNDIKPQKSLLSRLKHRIGSFFHGSG
jgi:hypothetical protein